MNRFSPSRPLPLLAGLALVTGLLTPTLCAAQATKAATGPTAATADAAGTEVTTSSGLVFKLVKQGTGPSPKASDTVKVHYRGTFPDGREFDSSYKRGQPIEFPLNGVIPCWTEGVQRMKPGGKAKLTDFDDYMSHALRGERAAGSLGGKPVIAVIGAEGNTKGLLAHDDRLGRTEIGAEAGSAK